MRETHTLSLLVGGALAVTTAVLLTIAVLPAGSAQWKTRGVDITFVSPSRAECFWFNSSLVSDNFCLWFQYIPGGIELNGTFGHASGQTLPREAIHAPILFPVCPPGTLCQITPPASWESSDHTGRVTWSLGGSIVSVSALE
jgi:hypothetical protein